MKHKKAMERAERKEQIRQRVFPSRCPSPKAAPPPAQGMRDSRNSPRIKTHDLSNLKKLNEREKLTRALYLIEGVYDSVVLIARGPEKPGSGPSPGDTSLSPERQYTLKQTHALQFLRTLADGNKKLRDATTGVLDAVILQTARRYEDLQETVRSIQGTAEGTERLMDDYAEIDGLLKKLGLPEYANELKAAEQARREEDERKFRRNYGDPLSRYNRQ